VFLRRHQIADQRQKILVDQKTLLLERFVDLFLRKIALPLNHHCAEGGIFRIGAKQCQKVGEKDRAVAVGTKAAFDGRIQFLLRRWLRGLRRLLVGGCEKDPARFQLRINVNEIVAQSEPALLHGRNEFFEARPA
jgi:hypothetical protein